MLGEGMNHNILDEFKDMLSLNHQVEEIDQAVDEEIEEAEEEEEETAETEEDEEDEEHEEEGFEAMSEMTEREELLEMQRLCGKMMQGSPHHIDALKNIIKGWQEIVASLERLDERLEEGPCTCDRCGGSGHCKRCGGIGFVKKGGR
jgi:hypothetical protein